tara:strand:- start:2368 stop:2622 length:255 start_codon:yes stop_codon:yes gene_type:complete
MKKTNIRLRNHFVIEDRKKFFLSSIDDLDKWKNINEDELESYKEDDNITDKINNLMKKYEIFSNVNFFDEEETKNINLQKGGGG